MVDLLTAVGRFERTVPRRRILVYPGCATYNAGRRSFAFAPFAAGI